MKAWVTPPTLAFGVILGVMAAPVAPVVAEAMSEWYDGLRPVIVGSVRVVTVDQHRAVISMKVDKRRECEYVRLVAYTIDADNVRRDATIRRMGESEGRVTRTVGVYELGEWEVYPRLGGRVVRVESVHDCDGRQVRTVLGQVELL